MDEKEFYKKFENYQLLKKEAAINKIPEWIERGNKVLSDDLHLKWKITVYSSAVSEACGIDIEEFLNYMEAIKNGISTDIETMHISHLIEVFCPELLNIKKK